MKVTSISEFRTEAGTYLEWPISLGPGVASDIPPSFNQNFHLASTLTDPFADASTVWIAAAFDVLGPVDIDALTWSFDRFVQRHPALRTSFHAAATGVARRVHDASAVSIGRPRSLGIARPEDVTRHLHTRLGELCHPSRSPSYSFAAISRPGRSTVVCGFDHAHVDAVSLTVAVDELSRLYAGRRAGSPVDLAPVESAPIELAPVESVPVELVPVGSFVEYCADEANAPVVPEGDPRIATWREFVRDCGGTTPSFPFDLGVALGEHAPQATTVHGLSSATQAENFERACRAQGAGMFAGLAAAVAEAVAEIGGPRKLPLLFPLHTRHDDRYSRAVGWFTTNAPMTVTVGDNPSTLASASASFRSALPLSTVPIPRVLGALGDDFTLVRRDVFMVSYMDYRHLPGAHEPERNAHHISNVTTADDAQFWVSRTDDGLSLRARFPDTLRAHAVMREFVPALAAAVGADATVQTGQGRTHRIDGVSSCRSSLGAKNKCP